MTETVASKQMRLDRVYREELEVLMGSPQRLEAVYEAAFLMQGLQAQLDQIMDLTRTILETPHAAVNLVYEHEVVVLSGTGNVPTLDEYVAASGERLAAEETYCHHIVKSAEPLVIMDSLEHPLVRGSLWAADVRAYLGVPLIVRGHVVGTICVTSERPREWNSGHIRLIAQCAALVQALIEKKIADSDSDLDVRSIA